MMPIAMSLGAIFYTFFGYLSFLTPYLIFLMLFFTYCHLELNQIKFSKLHLWLILIQIVGSITVFLLLLPINKVLAQGAMICVLMPTATSAPVITGMLQGNVASLSAYSLISNLTVALLAPIIFSLVGKYTEMSFFESFVAIGQRVFTLLFLPFILAILLRKIAPQLTIRVGNFKSLSFYLWTFALSIVTGKTVQFIMLQEEKNYNMVIIIAGVALIICLAQFMTGRGIGKKYNDTVAGGQGLGQKNTILAIWMAQMYLNPMASIGPGSYVLWQNIVNSYQVWRKRKLL